MSRNPIPFLLAVLLVLMVANLAMTQISRPQHHQGQLQPTFSHGPLDPPTTPTPGLTPGPSTVDARLADLEERVRSLEGYRGYQMRRNGSEDARNLYQWQLNRR
jgi:hypothetical protein